MIPSPPVQGYQVGASTLRQTIFTCFSYLQTIKSIDKLFMGKCSFRRLWLLKVSAKLPKNSWSHRQSFRVYLVVGIGVPLHLKVSLKKRPEKGKRGTVEFPAYFLYRFVAVSIITSRRYRLGTILLFDLNKFVTLKMWLRVFCQWLGLVDHFVNMNAGGKF